MIRFLLLVIFLTLGVAAYAWYSAQALPEWYQSEKSREDQTAQQLSAKIQQQGTAKFLGSKFADVMQGKLVLSEPEFNALLQASLQSSRDGRRLLQVSDAVNARITDDGIELGVIVNLEKVAKYDAKAKKSVDKVLDALPLLNKSRIHVGLSGQPIARNGELAIAEDYSISIGSIPLSSSLLNSWGVPTERLASESVPIKLLSIKSIATSEGEITLGVLPRF